MSQRVIFHPEDLDNNPRADCAIFFPERDNTSGRGISLSSTNDSTDSPNYLSIVELKSSYGSSNSVRDQIEGAIEFVVDVLSDCDDPPWGLECYCIVPHSTGYKRRRQVRFTKHIRGEHYIFRAEPVNNGESLRDIVERDIYSIEI